MKLDVVNIKGEKLGRKADLPADFFGIEPNDHAIYLAVKQFLANQRQGTHKSKNRNEIAGSTRKIKKQKGTGTARAGAIKNPLFRGGGRMFGPKPHEYGFKLNKKVKELAFRSALSYKAKEQHIMVVDQLAVENPKTREVSGLLKDLGLENEKVLMVVNEKNANMVLASRNISSVFMVRADQLSTYTVMNAT